MATGGKLGGVRGRADPADRYISVLSAGRGDFHRYLQPSSIPGRYKEDPGRLWGKRSTRLVDPLVGVDNPRNGCVCTGSAIVAGHWVWTGLWRLALKRKGAAPWCGHFFTQYRLRDWLELLGFELQTTHTLFYTPPLGNTRLQNIFESLDHVGRLLWPLFAGVYILSARKRSSTLTPIRPRMAYRRKLVGVSLAGPSSSSPHASQRRADK